MSKISKAMKALDPVVSELNRADDLCETVGSTRNFDFSHKEQEKQERLAEMDPWIVKKWL